MVWLELYLNTCKDNLLVEFMIIAVVIKNIHAVHTIPGEEIAKPADQRRLSDSLKDIGAERAQLGRRTGSYNEVIPLKKSYKIYKL